MHRPFTHATRLLLVAGIAQAIVDGRAAAAEPEEPEAPVTPFIDSGNTLPDLAARDGRPTDETPSVRGRWYGWQILLGDLATTTCALALEQGICIAPYFATGPGVHFAHGRDGLAAVSFGLRFLGPALGGSIGSMLANCPDRGSSDRWLDFCGVNYIVIGVLAGAAVAAVADASLGFERVEARPGPRPATSHLRTIEPTMSVGRGGAAVGIGAAF